MVIKGDIMRRSVVGGVEIIRVRRELSRKGIDFLDPRSDPEALPAGSYLTLGGLGIHGDLLVRETLLLCLEHKLVLDVRERSNFLDLGHGVFEILQLV